MRVALYLRRSTDEFLQTDSLATQEAVLRAHCTKYGFEVSAIYQDSGSGRSIDRRPDFKRLIADVQNEPPFEAVLVRDVSRWGRFPNIDESAYWEFFFQLHHVRVFYVEELFRDDSTPYAVLMKTIKRVVAAEHSEEKSRLIQRSKARRCEAGQWTNGREPYGMRRILVAADGTVVSELKRGERKAIKNLQVRLAPGPADEVAVVRRIFDLFTKDRLSRMGIAALLAAEGVAPPFVAAWDYQTVERILTREAYAGICTATFRASINFPQGETITTKHAWQGIISEDQFELAAKLLHDRIFAGSPRGLAAQFRDALTSWGHVEARMLEDGRSATTWEHIRESFPNGYLDAMQLAFRDEIEDARDDLRRLLQTRFRVAPRHDGGFVLDGLFHVAVKFSLPRAHRLRLAWEFRFSSDDDEDAVIGIGFSAPPIDVAAKFFFLTCNFRKRRPRRFYPTIGSGKIAKRFLRSDEELLASIEYGFARGKHVKEEWLARFRGHSVVNTYELARQWGEKETRVYSIYASLRRAGYLLPPTSKTLKHWVTFVCASCGDKKYMVMSDALARRSDLCVKCYRAGRRGSSVTCSKCGAVRYYAPSVIRRLSKGVNSLCRPCWLASSHQAPPQEA